jgi:hypothetical protein
MLKKRPSLAKSYNFISPDLDTFLAFGPWDRSSF